jgi:tetratricopeptide (TPR) repeat protein
VRRCNDLLVAEYSGFHLHLSGVAHLRMERYDQSAIEIRACLERVGSTPGGVHRYGNLTLAIALHQRGESTEAEEALSKGEAAIEEWTLQMAKGSVGTMPIDWWDWMESQLYLREAKVLIRGEAGPEDSRLADVRKRALAAITQGDAGSFMTAGREAVARRAWDDAAQNFSRVLDNLPMGFQPVSQEMQYCVEIVREPELFDRLVARRPDDSRLWYARARTFATRSEWAKASTDLAQALRLAEEKLKREGAEHLIGSQRTRATMMHELAALQLLAGDVDGYRALRGSTLRAESEFEDGLALSALSRALSVGPDAGYDPSSALRLGQQAVAVNPNSAWILFSLGAAQLRAGQYEEAVETLHRSLEIHPTWQGRGQNFVVLAMACHRLGRNYDARDWLEKSRVSLAELDDLREGKEFGLAASNYLVDWLMLRLLMPEAEKMMAE